MKYFLSQKENNWYCIPVVYKDAWNRVISKQDYSNYDSWIEFQIYLIPIEKLTFENPKF